MKFELFQFPLPLEGDLSELNQFLASHRVVSVNQTIVRQENLPLIVFVVEYLDTAESNVRSGVSDRVDYRQKFSPEDFALFSQLRDERKKIADESGVPVYTIVTNAQLAEIVERKVVSLADLDGIAGIGKARIEKFGNRLIGVITRFHAPSSEAES